MTIKNSFSKQLMKERLNELDGIDKANETKLKSRHNSSNANNKEYPKSNHSAPYLYKMRTRQRTNTIEPILTASADQVKPSMYQMRTRNRSISSEVVNETPDINSLRTKRPISIHEPIDSNSPVAKRIYQRSFSCDRKKVNAILNNSTKILEPNTSQVTTASPIYSFRRTNSLRQPASIERKKEYRRSLSTNTDDFGESFVLDRYSPTPNKYSIKRVSIPTQKVSRILRSSMYEPFELSNYSTDPSSIREPSVEVESPSRIKNTIVSLRESSAGPEPSIDSESSLIKRAISLESKNSASETRSSVYITQSLIQNSTSSKNVYKDFIGKIVNSRDGYVSRSIFNERNSVRPRHEPVKSSDKNEDLTNNKAETNIQHITEAEKEPETSNDVECSIGKPETRISKSNINQKAFNSKTGSKLPSRLTPNSEPILLRNRRYSIPRSIGSNKHETDTCKNLNKTHGTSRVSNGRETSKMNGQVESRARNQNDVHIGTNEVNDSNEGTKENDNSLENVEKVINTLENAQKNNRAESIIKLKRLDLSSKVHPIKCERTSTSRSLDHCDNSSRCSFLFPTEDSDGWSIGSDVTDIRGDCPSPSSPSSAQEESVSERIRRKSFFSRFNPRQDSKDQMSSSSRLQKYARSTSADNYNPNNSQQKFLNPKKSIFKTP